MTDDIFFATITELNEKLTARDFSAVELARAFATRLEKLGPRYNALALPLRERAVRAARQVDDELRRKRFRGPLQGIPYGVKDLLSLAGAPTTWGARPYAGQVFDYDATVLRSLDRTGAVLVGKLAMIQLAGAGAYRWAASSLTGPARNPWDRERWAGGSSSGSGAAVAAGLVPFALGTETWGSILTPCAYCGVTGLRPTYGFVSRHGAMALSWTMDKIGPMCRSAEDCGLVLHVIAGGDANDPASAGRRFYYTPQFARKPSQLRVGFAPVDFEGWADPASRPVFQTALAELERMGVKLVETELPELPYGLVAGTIISAEGSAVFESLIESGEVDQLRDERQINNLKAGLDIKARDYLRAMRLRTIVLEELRELFVKVDVLVSPSTFWPATRIAEPIDRPSQPRPKADRRGLRDLGAAGNLAGWPALSLPCGFVEGLPVAIQLVSRPFTENNLLMLGVEYQRRTDWHLRRPPV